MPEPISSLPQQNVYQSGLPPVPGSPPSGAVPPPPPKRQFPKILIYLGIGAAVIGLIILLAIWVFPRVRKIGQEEITWWGLWEEEGVITPLIEEYQKEHPGVKITYIKQSPQNYRERLVNSLAQGNGPDIFRFHNSWVPMLKNELDSLPPSVMSASDFVQTFYPVASADLTTSRGLVGIPLEYDALALFINEDIFFANGKSPPVTWDEFREVAIELTRKDEQGTITQSGAALGRTENVDHWPEILGLMMLQNGVNLNKPTGKLAEDALAFFTLFSSADRVWDETLPPSTIAFTQGKLAMYFGPSWRVFEIRQQNPGLKFRIASVPQLVKDSPEEPDVTYATYWVEGVWTRSEKKKEAWDFLKFLSSRESLEKLYENAAKIREFGEPYPRADMAELLTSHAILGPIVIQAKDAGSWYLQSRTFDGPTGINSQINKYFEDAVNSVNLGTPESRALETASQGVSQVLSQYVSTTP